MARNLQRSSAAQDKAIQRLSTGKRLNSAKDAPSEIPRQARFHSQIRANRVAAKNIQEGMSVAQTAESALSEMQSISMKLKELAVRYGNDTEDKQAIKVEAHSLLAEMENITKNTKWGDIHLFQKGNMKIQTGTSNGESMNLSIPKMGVKKNEAGRYELSTIKPTQRPEETEGPESVPEATRSNTDTQVYDFTVNGKKGKLTLGQETMHVEYEGKTYSGTYALNNKKAEFELSGNGETFTGWMNFTNDGKIDTSKEVTVHVRDAEGKQTPYKVKFTKTAEEEDPPIAPEPPADTPPSDKPKPSGFSIEQILTPDFVEQNLIKPIAEARSALGNQMNALEIRLNRALDTEIQATHALSIIEDADIARETLNSLTYGMLADINASLIRDFSYNHRQRVMSLLG